MAALKRVGALLILLCLSLVGAQGIVDGIIRDMLPDGMLDPADPPQKRYCRSGVHIIGVRGHGQQGEQPYGNLTSAVLGIKQSIPHSTNDSVEYPREPPPPPNATGGKHLKTKITRHARRCPNQPIVVMGYSQGGIIAMNTVCGGSANTGADNPPLDPKFLKQVIAVTVYGDETRTFGQSYNKGTCLSYGTLPRENPEGCDPYAKTIRSWCDAPDPLCCKGGTNRNAHSKYPTKYDSDLIGFVVKRYKAFKRQ